MTSSRSSEDGYDYVRSAYRLVFEVGDDVKVDGQPGTIVKGHDDQYIYVRERAMSAIWKCHPTWRLEVIR